MLPVVLFLARLAAAGGRLAATDHGVLVADSDAGALVALDPEGQVAARLPVAPEVAQVVVDPLRRRAWVSDRRGDAVLLVDLSGGGLRLVARVATPAEPYGLALTPDGGTLLVTTVAARSLVAYDAALLVERWRLPLAPEPRGVAVSPDGRTAVVTFLTTNAVARVDLGRPAAVLVPIDPSPGRDRNSELPLPQTAFARDAFAVVFTRKGTAVVPHVSLTPQGGDVVGHYGGSRHGAPVAARLALVTPTRGDGEHVSFTALPLSEPDSVAYDEATDTVWVAGLASDDVVAVHGGEVSRRELLPGCGPAGLAVTAGGAVIVWCDFSRQAVTLPAHSGTPRWGFPLAGGPPEAELRGRALFHHRSVEISVDGLTCAACHPDGRADGLSWRIGEHTLQTPFLAGRLIGTEPYKWTGSDPTLAASVRRTVDRVGGRGLDAADTADLIAYLKTMPRPRPRPARDPAAVARGDALFHDARAGCDSCHGGPSLTEGRAFLLGAFGRVDTPSLLAAGLSAPYFHDGSAATLQDVLLDLGSVHGMGHAEKLAAEEIADLTAYLESL